MRILELKQLQRTYVTLVQQVQQRLDAYAAQHAQDQYSHSPYPPATPPPPRRSLSPTFFKSRSKAESAAKVKAENEKRELQPTPAQVAYKDLATKFYSISSRHQISWECAELLVDLAGTAEGTTETPPATGGPESNTFGSPMSWKGSTGRNDLSHRQLILLREMLNQAPSEDGSEDGFGNDERPAGQFSTYGSSTYGSNYGSISQLQLHDGLGVNVNREWRWGDPGNSTVTLGMEEGEKKEKKRRSYRLGSGMIGIRDMLRALKKSTSEASSLSKQNGAKKNLSNASTTSLSTEGSHRYPHPRVGSGSKRRSRTSLALLSAYDDPLPAKTPRRPSLASIFRIGKRSGSVTDEVTPASAMPSPAIPQESPLSSALGDSDTEEEEDWDRMDSASDFEAKMDKHATVRGKGKMPPTSAFSSSRTSLFSNGIGLGLPSASTSTPAFMSPTLNNQGGPSNRPPRLSNVDENPLFVKKRSPSGPRPGSAPRPSSAPREPSGSGARHMPAMRVVSKSGSVRSIISPVRASGASGAPLPPPIQETKLSMAPENIRPLLENSKVVLGRLLECIEEVKGLVREHDGVIGGVTEEFLPAAAAVGRQESLEGIGDSSLDTDEVAFGIAS